MTKDELRKIITAKKRTLTDEQISAASRELSGLLEQNPHWIRADTVYLYASFNQEIRTDSLIRSAWHSGKKIAVPLCTGDVLDFRYITSPSDLHSGCWKIPEPNSDCPPASVPDALIIMPGLAFDGNGYRLGYGRGFYDRFLSAQPGHYTIALCYSFQVVPEVPHESHDLPVCEILSSTIV